MKKVLIISALLASLSGCAAFNDATGYKVGTPVSQEQVNKFVLGKSTKADILKTLGAPQEQQELGSELHYIYLYTEIHHFAAGVDEQTRFIFNKSGTLKEVQKGNGSGRGNPLLGG